MRFPVILRLLIPLITSVILHFYTSFSVGIEVIITLTVFLGLSLLPAFLKFKWSKVLFNLCYPLIFFFLGGFICEVHQSQNNDHYFTNFTKDWNNEYLVEVIEPPVTKENSIKCVVEVRRCNETRTCGKSLIYFQKEGVIEKPQYGDLIYLRSNFKAIKANGNPKEFDYSRYLMIHNITEQAYVKSDQWMKVGNDANPVLSWIFDLRESLNKTLQESGMSAKNAMVANALLLGQKEYLDKDVLRSYSSAGAMHVLAVSGLHVGIIMLILTSLLTPLKKIRKGQSLFILLVLLGIWFYAIITGLSPSVMRAAVMFSFIVIGKELQRDTTIYQSIMVSAFLLIILEPYIIFQVGFQLSYLAVLGIVFLQLKIENLFYIKNKILYKAWQISAVSIAAQIATFPLGLYYFHQFPNFFMLSNLIVIPLAFCILIVGISYLCLHVIPFLSDLLLWLLDAMISILNWGVEFVQTLPYSILWGISIEWYEVVFIYCTLILASVAFIYRKSSALVGSLVLSVILLVFNVWEQQKIKNEDVLCIYNVNDDLAMDVFHGDQNIFFSTQEMMNDEEKLLFHIKHHWFYRTGQEEPTKWKDISGLDYWNFADFNFGIVSVNNHQDYLQSTPRLDYAVLSDIDYVDKAVIEVFEESGTQIIIANDVGYKLKRFLRKSYGNQLHDLKEDGAFLLTSN